MKFVKMLKGKIHGAVVTDANVEYEGSITVDSALMESAGILEHEAVHVWNMTGGSRLETYAIPAPPGSGTICLNGAAALHNHKGDKVIIAAFELIQEENVKSHGPRLVYTDSDNKPVAGKDG
ncbi:MAG: aspartate 1-decarboxylase [Pseudomonadota bacterium]